MKKTLLLVIAFMFLSFQAWAADVTIIWDASADATGYKIYQSVDNGVTWDSGTDVGNVTTYIMTDVPDTGLVMFRTSAYNDNGESIAYWKGAWYWGDKKPPEAPTGTGIQ